MYNMNELFMTLFGSLANGIIAGGLGSQEQQYNSEEAALNRAFQRSERLATQEYMTDMWEKSNEYNSIGAQISRARAAGVSPSAIIGGGYKSAIASPMSSTPMNGSMASSNNAGALGSALMGSMPNMLNAVGNYNKDMTYSFVAREMLSYNKAFINSQVHANYGTLAKMLADVGVADATEAQIRSAIRWIDPLNYATYQQTMANLTQIYNSCYVQLQELEIMRGRADSQNAVDVSTIKLNESTAGVNDANAEAQRIRNTYLEDQQKAFTSIQEAEAWEADLRVVVADMLGVPLGSSEFEFNYGLWKTGQLPAFCDEVITPTEQATWKPQDKVQKTGFNINTELFGVPFSLGGSLETPFGHNVQSLFGEFMQWYDNAFGEKPKKIDVRKRATEIKKGKR